MSAKLVVMVAGPYSAPTAEGRAANLRRMNDVAATYNVRRGIAIDGRLNVSDVAEVLAASGVDVVGLQEVPRGMLISNGVDVVTYLSRRLGLRHTAFQGSSALPSYGTAVLSRYPLDDVTLQPFSGTGRDHTRGMVAATVRVPGADGIHFVTAHLEPGAREADRVAQARIIAEHVHSHPRSVVAADCNAGPGSAPVETLVAGGLRTAPVDATYPSTAPTERIDWLLHTGDVAVLEVHVPHSLASDHLPVVARLSV